MTAHLQVATNNRVDQFEDRAQERRDHKNKQAQILLTNWYMQKFLSDGDGFLSKERMQDIITTMAFKDERSAVFSIFRLLGDDAAPLFKKFHDLEPYELETLGSLRDEGASIPDLIDYLRAEPGFNAEGKPVRHEMATNLRKKQFNENTKKLEARSRIGFGIAAGLGALGIGVWMAVSGDTTLLTNLPTVVSEPLSWAAESVGSLFKNLVLGGAIIGGWKTYKAFHDIRSGTPKLDIGKDSDFSDMTGPIARPNYEKLNIQFESIFTADQHLIKHLSPTELRFFLMGGNATRHHIFSTNPPTQRALLEAAVESMGRDESWKNSIKVAWLMVTAPLRRENSETGVPKLEEKMENWRRNAAINRVAANPRSRGNPTNM
jgi:hypothetical protein